MTLESNESTLTDMRVGLAVDMTLRERPPFEAYSDPASITLLVRESISQVMGSSNESTFSGIIEPGMTVLLKPNWVCHHNCSNSGMECVVTQPAFILAVLSDILRSRPAKVLIGDAPIQGCSFDEVVTDDFKQAARNIADAANADLEILDFRRTTVKQHDFVKSVRSDLRDLDRYLLFDLAGNSLLEPITEAGRFRVTNYDPDKLAESHRPGRHLYLIARDVLEADVVLSLPKPKTHRKAGLTGALKNLVGINGNKDYLPHHRVGGSADGGDCYPGKSMMKRAIESMLDKANKRIGKPSYLFWSRCASIAQGRLIPVEDGELEGGWFGNDTCWRMVLDLNRILLYGRPDGTMAEVPQRTAWSLADAIVCGQGEGPLCPEPLMMGAVTFSRSAPAADAVHAALMRLDHSQIPLIRESFSQFHWPLAAPGSNPIIHYCGRVLDCAAVAEELGVRTIVPSGWSGHIELE